MENEYFDGGPTGPLVWYQQVYCISICIVVLYDWWNRRWLVTTTHSTGTKQDRNEMTTQWVAVMDDFGELVVVDRAVRK